MIQSLLVKLGMLAMTMGVVLWIGWQAPQASVKDAVSAASTEAVPGPATAPEESEKNKVREANGRSAPAKPVATANIARVEAASPQKGLLDLNHASAEDLESLPGIGAVLAQRMIAYRASIGGFRTVEDLRQVKGIGEKKLDRVRPLVIVVAPGTKGKTEKQPL